MTQKEKVAIYTKNQGDLTCMSFVALFGGKIKYCDDHGRVSMSINLRQRINDKMQKEGITKSELARAINYDCSNLSNFLSGRRRSIPHKKLEEVLALLELMQ